MTQRGRTVTAALLTIVLLTALGILSTTISAEATTPEPIDVSLDFDTFLPGETQTRTYPVNVPSAARFAEAGVLHATGIAEQVQWTFRLCEEAASASVTPCAAVDEGTDVPAGAYTLEVSALLDANVSGEGSVAGRVRLEQADGGSGSGFTPMHWMIAAAVVAVLIGGIGAIASSPRPAERPPHRGGATRRQEPTVGSPQ